ncbi:MAG: hypothetical protein B7Y25_01320 [Alphaproteobacteria bacterium 16-39-46]|nr:MAG: hypothetical protein B7Y25_01320 [Alphaproteobacteria bacterium 16-39-46]OZA42795.1 MAG: hypothetical protein B7X84_04950 [Alphaproteobacteria bacterium 17-39-52]HQS84300.1 hypothetical protein [Alphaproteobacteria bacterium]HQS94128.1 hypothetical protein [Alphaproteobacteria bacterium]
MLTQKSILLLGCGYVGKILGRRLLKEGWQVFATTRAPESQQHLKELGFNPVLFSRPEPLDTITHVLSSIPPSHAGDDGLSFLIKQKKKPSWIGYLSSTSVYGDHHGDWVDENSETRGETPEGLGRLRSEDAWKKWAERQECAFLIYRLSGIYGPYRNVFQRAIEGTDSPKMRKPNHVFSRIHVDDICTFLVKSLSLSSKFSLFNGADDRPASFEDVRGYAYSLLGHEVSFKKEKEEEKVLSSFSFFKENRRVSNQKMKEFVGEDLKFPTFREGLKDIFEKRLF